MIKEGYTISPMKDNVRGVSIDSVVVGYITRGFSTRSIGWTKETYYFATDPSGRPIATSRYSMALAFHDIRTHNGDFGESPNIESKKGERTQITEGKTR